MKNSIIRITDFANSILSQDNYNIEEAVFFTGHRVDKFGGKESSMKHPKILALKEALLVEIENEILNHNKRIFISGGALGVDQVAFWCVEKLKRKYESLDIKNIVAIPYQMQSFHPKWNEEQRHWYHKMISIADEVIDVARLEKYDSKEYERKQLDYLEHSNQRLFIRNLFMVDYASKGIGVYDGSPKSGTKNCIDYAKKKNKQLVILNPSDIFSKYLVS